MHQAEELDALTARLVALESVWQDGVQGEVGEVLPSIRRIAGSLERSLEAYGDPDLAASVRELQAADGETLRRRIPDVVDGIRRMVASLPRESTEILLVEDDAELRARLARALEADNRKVRAVASGAEAEEALDDAAFDLVVLDLDAEALEGRDHLVTLRSRPTTAATPIVVLSSRAEPAFRAECIALGADEFLEKPLEPELFSAVVSARLGRTAALTRLAQEDHLTGLPTRAAFSRIFHRLHAIAERGEEPLALALVDVDNLKQVNDRLGHSEGDRVLETLAESASRTLRDADVLGRWGGDEFVALLPSTDVDGATEALDKARRAFLEQIDEEGPGGNFDLSLSAGVTAVRPGDTVESAVARADRYLYQAKSAGRDHVVGERAAVDYPARDVLLVEDEESVARVLRRFLERDGFAVRRAADGDEALEMVRGTLPDLMILDIMLPGRNGFEVLREMRGDPELQDLPVLILTALGEEEAVVKGFRLGVDEYLSKPVSREDFLARVRTLARTS